MATNSCRSSRPPFDPAVPVTGVFSVWLGHSGSCPRPAPVSQAREPGSRDIYLMDIASKQWVQLTHDGRSLNPVWSVDGIVFDRERLRPGENKCMGNEIDGLEKHKSRKGRL